jgi:transcriptional regulator
MYTPTAFALDETDAVAHLADTAVATLVVVTAEGEFEATSIPFLVDGRRLVGHVAKANPIWRSEGKALVVCAGPDGYVSPSWYPSKAEHGRVVPTWNYVTVHVRGSMVAHHEREWKRDVVTRLTNHHEGRIGSSWQVTDAPAGFIDKQLDAIVGIEISISQIEGKAKLSQNRPAADVDGVVSANRNAMGDAVSRARVEAPGS